MKIAETKDVPPGRGAAFEVEGRRIALFNVDGRFYAISDLCPHNEGPLSEGKVEGFAVVCPWHGARFDLRTGAVLEHSAAESVKSYRLTVENDNIMVEI